MPDITNQQLLEALTEQLSVITDTMATKEELYVVEQHIAQLEARIDTKLDNLEIRLGRRIDLFLTNQ